MTEYNFKKLTPDNNLKNLTIYQEAIDYALNDKEIKNIAITGIYGSGKSSIIETYKMKTKQKRKFIHISLAHFQDTENENNSTAGSKNLTRNKILEGKILNQLLHQIKSTNIPQTIFKVKNDISKKKIVLWSLIFSIMLLLITYLIMFDSWVKFASEINQNFTPLKWVLNLSMLPLSRLFVSIIVFAFFTWLMYLILYAQVSRKILKTISIKSKNIESNIEVFSESKDSYFDKYLDDVIYLFDHSKADVVVFEDIDRFDSNIIFSKLKEINTLVNNRKKSRQNSFFQIIFSFLSKIKYINSLTVIKRASSFKKLSFLYLLKDDMFISKDRTKFFDFIIPVLPVINSSNSYEKLKEILEEDKIFDKFDKSFLQDLSLYIDDMRLLKNICNEFIIYKGRLKESEFLNYNNLLAIIVYKNIFPNDFANLQLNKGLVYQVFSEKKEYIDREKKSLDDQIADLRRRIENANQEELKSEKELYTLFFNMPDNYYNVIVDGKKVENFKNRSEFVYALKNGSVTVSKHSYGGQYNVSFEEIFTDIERNQDFIDRRKIILDKEKLEKLTTEINLLENEKRILSAKKIFNFILRQDIEKIQKEHFSKKIESFDDIKKSDYFDLLVFILVNGYMDEGYEDYLTYFYPNSLKLNDKKFLRSITDERKLEWDFKLSNISEVYDRLSSEAFLKIESLNYDLFEYILNDSNLIGRSDRLDKIFGMILREDKIDFLVKMFISKDSNLVKKVIVEWKNHAPELFLSLIRNNTFTNNEKSRVLVEFIENFNQEDLFKIDSSKKEIIEFIKSQPEFLNEISQPSEDFLDKLRKFNIKFKTVVFSKINISLSRYIYKNSLYDINMNNVSEVLNFFHNKNSIKDVEHKNYTIIKMLENEPIVEYIDTNIEKYLEEYLSLSKEKTEDDINYIYDLLNNEKLSIEIRKRYIDTVSVNDLLLSNIHKKDLWDYVLKHNIIRPNESNIIDYFIFNESTWNKNLIEFTNKNKSELVFKISNTGEKYEDDLRSSFFVSTLKEFSLENIAYKKILVGMNRRYNDGFPVEGIPKEKVDILIDTDRIKLTKNSLLNFRSQYPDSVIYFISKNIDLYVQIADGDDIYNVEELNNVLDYNLDQPFSIQKKIVNLIAESISISGKGYRTNLMNYILQTKFHQNDLGTLCVDYEQYSLSTKSLVYDIATQNINIILEEKISINKNLLNDILKNVDIPLNKRRLLFSRAIQVFSKSELRDKFNQLNLTGYLGLINGKGRTSFEMNETNRNLLSYLSKKKLISSFNEVNGTYRANANKRINQI